MKNNPYKAFIAFSHNLETPISLFAEQGDDALTEALAEHEHRDPFGGQWRNGGLATVNDSGLFVLTLGEDSAYLMHVQFNERMLPAKVRDEKVRAKVKEITEQQGHKVGKKQYAEIREEVEHELLPKAFIKRTVVPVIFVDQYVLVFTSSVARAGSTTAYLVAAMQDVTEGFALGMLVPKGDIIRHLTDMVEGDDMGNGEIDDFAVFKSSEPGDDKKTVRVKDLNLGSSEVTNLMKQDYRVHDIALRWYDGCGFADEFVSLEFKLNEKLVFRGCTMPGVKTESVKRDDAASDAASFAWLVAKTYTNVLMDVLKFMGGAAELTVPQSDEEEL